MSTVGENILLMRKRLGWTQEELATKMGYKSKSTINKIEMGINDIPQSKIVKFAEVLGTTPAHLMGWNDEEETLSPEDEGEKLWMELYNRLSDETRITLTKMMCSFEKLPAERQRLALDLIRVALGDQK